MLPAIDNGVNGIEGTQFVIIMLIPGRINGCIILYGVFVDGSSHDLFFGWLLRF